VATRPFVAFASINIDEDQTGAQLATFGDIFGACFGKAKRPG
jgi:hypothetical protein